MLCENTPTLITERLILRQFTEDDVEDMLLLFSDEEVNKFLPWFPIKTESGIFDYLQHQIFPCYQKNIAYNYAVALKSDNRVIGYVNIHDIGRSNDFGYALHKEYWHKGIMTEACKVLVDRLRKTNFSFITATHDVNNPYSGKIMQNLGMTYQYSYHEKWQPKNLLVTFRMYQLIFDKAERTYIEYQKKHPYFVEQI